MSDYNKKRRAFNIESPKISKRKINDQIIRDELRRYQNTKLLTDVIAEIHNIPEKQRQNALKQASQISFSIEQGLQYLNAASSVSMQARPLLLYYAITSFASAELLLLAPGSFSFDAIADRYKSHGLSYHIRTKLSGDISDGDLITVEPLVDKHGARGLFGAWSMFHYMDHAYTSVLYEFHDSPISQTGLAVFGNQTRQRIDLRSFSFNELIGRIACMREDCSSFGLQTYYVRSSIDRTQRTRSENGHQETVQFMIHPDKEFKLNAAIEKFAFSPRLCNDVNINYGKTGGSFELTFPDGLDYSPFRFPIIKTVDPKMSYIMISDDQLSDYAAFYLSMYILGMLSRYHPHEWMKYFERKSEFMNLTTRVCDAAISRVPVLVAQRLSNCIYVDS